MTTWIALLRGINVGGQKKVAMSDLRALLARLGMKEPQSMLNSGNLLFDAEGTSAAQIEQMLENETAKRLGVESRFFVRSSNDWNAMIAANPLTREAESDPGHFLVALLKDAPDAERVRALQNAIVGREIVRVKGRHTYAIYPDGVGRSKLTHALLEKKLGTFATARNWNTVLKLKALAAERG